jgi:hypothetical protein
MYVRERHSLRHALLLYSLSKCVYFFTPNLSVCSIRLTPQPRLCLYEDMSNIGNTTKMLLVIASKLLFVSYYEALSLLVDY